MPDYNLHWNMHGLMTRGAMWNYAIGGRGVGKTYEAKYKRIRHYLKTKKQFIYLRRYKSEFDDKDKFFSDVANEFPQYEFKVDGMTGLIRKSVPEGVKPPKWQPMCFFITLATTIAKKSVPYPDVDFIIFDEFIIDQGSLHYISNEVTAFLDFYNTVDRFQDRVKVLFLANAVSIINPYFMYFHISPRRGQSIKIYQDGYSAVEIITNDKYAKHAASTRFGQMIKGTEYFNYAIGNTFKDDSDLFIKKKPDTAVFYYSFLFDKTELGVWVDYATSTYYVCGKIRKDGIKFVLTKDDLEPDMMMLDKSSFMLKNLKRLYMAGNVYFDTAKNRELFKSVMEYMNVR